jgi:uncharacterized protein YyaL (SSP411 family)
LSALVRLAGLTQDEKWLAQADALFTAITPQVSANYLGHVGILNALDLRLRAVEIVTVGPQRAQLAKTALQLPFTERILIDIEDPAQLPGDHPAHAQAQQAGDAAAFLCSNGTCSLPLRDPQQLAEVFAERAGE